MTTLATACGDAATRPDAGPDAADLQVAQVWDESSGLYAEGARSYIAVENIAGDVMVEAELLPTSSGTGASVRLEPGEYRLVSWQRPCDGSCDDLDDVTDRCSERFSVEPRSSTAVRIVVRAGSGCSMAFSS